ncbi:MAG: hypothetical protein NTW49_07745 [Bacteroidia bacterium]|nr:hypothetical protein [Bacteroidia bacterium]
MEKFVYCFQAKSLLVFMCLFLNPCLGFTQLSITAGQTITESFSIGTSATASLPTGWKADKNSLSRTVSSYASASSNTEQRGGNNMGGTATNGIYNFAAGDPSLAFDRAVGGISTTTASKSVNVYVRLHNSGTVTIPSLILSYDVEKYRNGSNPAGFSIQMYFSADGSTWSNAGSNFLVAFSANADNNGFSNAPGSVVSVLAKTLNQSMAVNADLYLAWNYSVSSGTSTGNAQALGIDNVSITANQPLANSSDIISSGNEAPAISYTSYTSDQISTTSDGIRVWSFTVRDGGGTMDIDTLRTSLLSLTIGKGANNSVASWASTIRQAAIFHSGILLAEVPVTGESITFSGNSGALLTVPDNDSASIDLYLSFKTTSVIDHQQFQLRIISAGADPTGSSFGQADAGGAISSVQSGVNRINVMATRLGFIVQPPSTVYVNNDLNPQPVIAALDDYSNTDLDFSADIIVGNSGSVLMSGIPGQISSGLLSFPPGFRFLATDTVILTVSANGVISAVSDTVIIRSNTTDHFRTVTSGQWSTAFTWQASFDGNTWYQASDAPSNAAYSISVTNGHSVTVSTNQSAGQVTIEAGAIVNINPAVVFTISNGSSPGMMVYGELVNAGTVTPTGSLEFMDGGIYLHHFTTSRGTVPSATWHEGSTCEISGYTTNTGTPGGLVQSFADFIWNCPQQTGNISLGGNLSVINGSFIVQSTGTGSLRMVANTGNTLDIGGACEIDIATLNLSSGTGNVVINLSGDLVISGGTITKTGSGNGTINFKGSQEQHFIRNGGTFTGALIFDVLAGSVLDMSDYILDGSGIFSLESGATLIIGSPDGISSIGAQGNIRLTGARNFSSGAAYFYNSTGSQVTGNGLPPVISSLSVSGSSQLSLSQPVNVTGDLLVSSGAILHIPPSCSLSVDGLSELDGPGCLVIHSGTTGTGSFIDHGFTGNGTAIVERCLNGNAFHLVSLPVSNTIPGGSSQGQTGTVFLNCTLDKYNEAADSWQGLTSADDVTPDKGYVTKYVFGGNAPNSRVLQFEGNLNHAEVSFPVTRIGNGYNLIGNPYPSPVDWDASTGWTRNCLVNNAGYDIWIWNDAAGSWASYHSGCNGLGINAAGNIIPAGQGFFVRSAFQGSLGMSDGIRVLQDQFFLKNNDLIRNLIRLKVSDGTYSDEVIVSFDSAAGNYEGTEKWFSMNEEAPDLYTIKNNQKYSINVLPVLNNEITIPLDFRVGSTGSYLITPEFCATVGYSFNANISDPPERFLLHFIPYEKPDSVNVSKNTVIYSYGSDIYIYNYPGAPCHLDMFSCTGECLLSRDINTDKNNKISTGLSDGVYLVRLRFPDHTIARRLLIF